AEFGDTFVLPEAKVQESTMYIPGTDGTKMSRSNNNYINVFLEAKSLRKQVMAIETDSTALQDPKDYTTCNVFGIYKLLANTEQIEKMKANYSGGNYGYGHAKQELFELIETKFRNQRDTYHYYMNNLEELDKILKIGATKAAKVANHTLARVRRKIGY